MSRPTHSDKFSVQWIERFIGERSARGIASSVAGLIRAGELNPGDRLPPVRNLAEHLRVSPSTVSEAWMLLKSRGLLAGAGRSGTTVSSPAGLFPARYIAPDIMSGLDLRYLYPDGSLLPSLEESLHQAAQLPNLDEYFREPILAQLHDVIEPTWPYTAESYVAVGGISSGARSVLRSVSVPGDRVALETPTNPPLIRIIKDLGLTSVPVDWDDEGPTAAGLKRALKSHPVAFIYQPRAQVPTGRHISERRAHDLGGLLGRHPAVTVLEYDDINSLSTEPAISIGSSLPGRVVLIRSFEKSYGPDLRLAVIGGPAGVLDVVRWHTLVGQQWTSRILQSALAWLIADPDTSRRIAEARLVYQQRLLNVKRELASQGVSTTGRDGLCLWVDVHDESKAINFLAVNGVLVHPGSESQPNGGPPYIRLATSRIQSRVTGIAQLIAVARNG